MPNLQNKNELSRTEIHQEDVDSFAENDDSRNRLHREDISQVKELSDRLERHCIQNEESDRDNKQRDKDTNKKLDLVLAEIKSLTWLNDDETKPVIKEIVKDAKGKTWLSVQVAKWLKVFAAIGVVLGILWTSIQISNHWKN